MTLTSLHFPIAPFAVRPQRLSVASSPYFQTQYMDLHSIHFTLENTLKRFPLIDLWLYSPSCKLPMLESLVLECFITVADPEWIALKLHKSTREIRLTLASCQHFLTRYEPDYIAAAPQLQSIEAFLRWPLWITTHYTNCTSPLQAYGRTYGEILFTIRKEGLPLSLVPKLSEQCRLHVRRIFKWHLCIYLLDQLEKQWALPPPWHIDRSPRLPILRVHHNN